MRNYTIKIIDIMGNVIDKFDNEMTPAQAKVLEMEPEFVVIEK